MEDSMEYAIGEPDKVTLLAIQEAALEAWAEASQPGTAAHAGALAAGIPDSVLSTPLVDLIQIQQSAAGIDLSGVHVLVGTAAAAVGSGLGLVAKDIWKHVLLPKIRRKYGDLALRELESAKAAKTTADKKKAK